MLEAVAATDGYNEYLFVAPEEPLMKVTPTHKNELIIKTVPAPEHNENGSTPVLNLVFCKSACARLGLESLCAVS
jgi:hypothetical protein